METGEKVEVRGEERGRWVFPEHIVGLKMLSIFNLKGVFFGGFCSRNPDGCLLLLRTNR